MTFPALELKFSSLNAFTFNATGLGNIAKTGISKFSARNANYDAANVAPTWSSLQRSALEAFYADNGGSTNDPKLVVTFTGPGALLVKN